MPSWELHQHCFKNQDVVYMADYRRSNEEAYVVIQQVADNTDAIIHPLWQDLFRLHEQWGKVRTTYQDYSETEYAALMKYFAQQSEDIVQKINEMDEVDSDKPPLNYLARFI